MKTVSILRPAAWAGAITLVLGMQAALAEPLVYVPLGGEGKIVVVDAAKDEIVDTISGVTAVHGLARTPDGQFLIAGSFDEREASGEALAKPLGISEDEHAAHHGGSAAVAGKAQSVVSTLSVISTADGAVVRRIDVPGAVHHVAVSVFDLVRLDEHVRQRLEQLPLVDATNVHDHGGGIEQVRELQGVVTSIRAGRSEAAPVTRGNEPFAAPTIFRHGAET